MRNFTFFLTRILAATDLNYSFTCTFKRYSTHYPTLNFNNKKLTNSGHEKLQSNSKIIIKTQNESCQLYPSRQRTTCHRCLVSKSYLSLVINWKFLSALIFCIFLAALALSVQLGSLQSDLQVHNNRTRNRNPSWRHRLSDNIFQFPFSTSHEIREENFYYLWHLS